MEIRGTQMVQEGLVSSDEKLKDAFREKEKREMVQEGGSERRQSNCGAMEISIQKTRG